MEQYSGRPSIVPERMKRVLKREVIRNRRQCVKDDTNSMEMSPYAVRKTLKELGYQRRVAWKKPLISEVNRKRPMDWTREFESKDYEFWQSVIWSDKSKFCQYSNSRQVYVWRNHNETWKTQCLQVTVKYGGIGEMVWGAV